MFYAKFKAPLVVHRPWQYSCPTVDYAPPPDSAWERSVRESTSQCGVTPYSDNLVHQQTLTPCDDWPSAVRCGGRQVRNGPFAAAGCRAKWFTPVEACKLLRRQNRLLILMGDSLTRHLVQGIVILLSGNYSSGGYQWFTPEGAASAETCKCDGQFEEISCRHFAMGFYAGNKATGGPRLCPGIWDKDYLAPLIYSHDHYNEELHLREVGRAAAEGFAGTVSYISVALHRKTDFREVHHDVWAHAAAVNRALGPGHYLLFGTAHAPQRNKPEQYWAEQGLEAVAAYDAQLRAAAHVAGIDVFESFSVTQDADSFDGTHYMTATNTVLGQLFLNYLAQEELQPGVAARTWG